MLRWLETVALPVDSGVVCEHQHLLRAMDVLVEHSDKLNSKLATLMRPLIDQDLSVVFYDLTTVAVTGQTKLDDDVRAYGMAKSGLVERQFMLSLVQTAEGLPIAHEVHPGNTAEAKTLLPMIRGLLARYPLKRVVLIADRGLLSTANIEELDKLQTQLKKDAEVRHPFGEIPVSPPRLANEFKDLPQFLGLNQKISVVARFSSQVVFISRSALHSASCLSRSPNREIAATPSWSSPFATSKANPVNAPSAPWVALRPVVKSTP